MPVQWEQENIAVASGAVTIYKAQLPAKKGAKLVAAMAGGGGASQGPFNVVLGFGDSGQGFYSNLLATGWLRNDANNLGSDTVIWNSGGDGVPIDTIAARPVVTALIRNDTGAAGVVLINYAYEVPE